MVKPPFDTTSPYIECLKVDLATVIFAADILGSCRVLLRLSVCLNISMPREQPNIEKQILAYAPEHLKFLPSYLSHLAFQGTSNTDSLVYDTVVVQNGIKSFTPNGPSGCTKFVDYFGVVLVFLLQLIQLYISLWEFVDRLPYLACDFKDSL